MTRPTAVITSAFRATAIFSGALLIALPVIVAQTRETESIRTIDVRLSRFAFSPERIEVHLGEAVRLNVVSTDGTHGFQVKGLGLNVRIPAHGATVTIDLTPRDVGTFDINCSEYCGTGHRRMKAQLVVSPAP